MNKYLLRRLVLGIALGLCLATPAGAGEGEDIIKIGGVFTYTGMPDWAGAAQNAAQMAVDEWNAKGGLKGRKAELLLRDDRGDPAAAVQVGEDLIHREHVVALTGVSFTNVSLAVASLADREKTPYVPVWCWKDTCTDRANKMIFALDSHPSEMIAPLADWAARQPIKRWGALIPSEEFSRTALKYFETELKKRRPDAEIVDVRTYQFGTNPFAQMINIFRQKKIEGLFNSVAAETDLPKYVRATRQTGFDKKITTIDAYLPPEAAAVMKNEAPEGWHVQAGYAGADLQMPENKAFVAKFQKRFGGVPGDLAFRTYVSTQFVLGAISKAGSAEPAAIAAALRGLTIDTPVGPVTMDAQTQRSDLGYWYGTTAVKDGTPHLVDFKRDGAEAKGE